MTANAVIAWRLTAMILFSDLELLALRDFAKTRRLPAPENLRQAVLTMAAWAGPVNRLPSPGSLRIWDGSFRLESAAEVYGRAAR